MDETEELQREIDVLKKILACALMRMPDGEFHIAAELLAAVDWDRFSIQIYEDRACDWVVVRLLEGTQTCRSEQSIQVARLAGVLTQTGSLSVGSSVHTTTTKS